MPGSSQGTTQQYVWPSSVSVKNYYNWLNDSFPNSNFIKMSKMRKWSINQHFANLHYTLFTCTWCFWKSFCFLWTLGNLFWLWSLGTCEIEDILLRSYYFNVHWIPGQKKRKKKRIEGKEICWMVSWLLCFQQVMDVILGTFDSLVIQLSVCSVLIRNWPYFTQKWKMRLTKNLVIKPLAKRKARKKYR